MRVNSKWLAALLLLGLIPLAGCNLPVVKKLQARDYVNKGVAQFTKQKYDAAAQYFQKSVELDPSFEVARMYLGTAYMSQFIPGSSDPRSTEMANKAIETFKGIAETSTDPTGKNKLNSMLSIVGLYTQMKKNPEAKEWCDKVLEVDPKNAEAYYRVAVMDYDSISGKTGLQGQNVKDLSDEEKTKLRAEIEEGLDYVGKALQYREGYYDAMEYQNLLWREKAKLETDEEAKKELIRQADKVALESLRLKRKAQEEAAKAPKVVGKKAE